MTVRKQAITLCGHPTCHTPLGHLRNNASNHELEIFLVIDHQLSKQTHFSYFAAMAFHGMIKANLEQISWSYPPFKQSQLGKILLGVSIFIVVLFAITLVMNWISNPDMFKPVLDG